MQKGIAYGLLQTARGRERHPSGRMRKTRFDRGRAAQKVYGRRLSVRAVGRAAADVRFHPARIFLENSVAQREVLAAAGLFGDLFG